MPKIKTNRGAAKRFSKTASGKIKRGHAFTSHILTPKTRKNKRQLRKGESHRRRRPEERLTAHSVQVTSSVNREETVSPYGSGKYNTRSIRCHA